MSLVFFFAVAFPCVLAGKKRGHAGHGLAFTLRVRRWFSPVNAPARGCIPEKT
jgi:hypothetical protein